MGGGQVRCCRSHVTGQHPCNGPFKISRVRWLHSWALEPGRPGFDPDPALRSSVTWESYSISQSFGSSSGKNLSRKGVMRIT